MRKAIAILFVLALCGADDPKPSTRPAATAKAAPKADTRKAARAQAARLRGLLAWDDKHPENERFMTPLVRGTVEWEIKRLVAEAEEKPAPFAPRMEPVKPTPKPKPPAPFVPPPPGK